MLLQRKGAGGRPSDLILVKEVKSGSPRQGGKRLGDAERNEHLKQLGWIGVGREDPGNSEEEVAACPAGHQAPLPTPRGSVPYSDMGPP